MNRADLLDAMGLAMPALSDSDLVPVLQCLAFDGGSITAYNDTIGVWVPFASDFQGAVPGKLLNALLSASGDAEIDFKAANDGIRLTGKSKSRVMQFPLADFQEIFQMVSATPDKALPIDFPIFAKALQGVMRSCGHDSSQPDTMGVTMIINGDMAHLYATNNHTLSYEGVKLLKNSKIKNKRTLISSQFCKQFLALLPKIEDPTFEVHDGYILLSGSDASPCVLGQILTNEAPTNFDGIVATHYSDAMKEALVEIPDEFEAAVARAIVIAQSARDQSLTLLEVTPGKKGATLKMETISDMGECKDEIAIDAHAGAAISVRPQFLAAGFDAGFLYMSVDERCLIMQGLAEKAEERGGEVTIRDAFYMIAAHAA